MTRIAKPPRDARVSRRMFLTAAGALGVGLQTPDTIATIPLLADAKLKWNGVADIVICGTGAAGFTAAVIAASSGSRVLMLEKASTLGGTTVKSGGAWWAPNNALMRADGLLDEKAAAIAYMARCSAPQFYDSTAPNLGLPQAHYDLIEAYFDNAAVATDELVRIGALRAAYFRDADGTLFTDYYAHLPEDKAPVGRCLGPAGVDGKVISTGTELINQLHAAAIRLGVKMLPGHRAERLVTNAAGRVIGIVAVHEKESLAFNALKGTIFATGGFTHNAAMADSFLRGPIFGGCAVPSNTGDFVSIAAQVGAALGNMAHAWWAEVVLEQALSFSSVPSDVFILGGDSMLVANRNGDRIYNEKALYNERTQAHFVWDPQRCEYPNLLSFMIYDDRVAQQPGSGFVYPLPTAGFTAPYVISADSVSDLAQRIDERLRSLDQRAGIAGRVASNFRLAPRFVDNLGATIRRFNTFAETGNDAEFHRGDTRIERAFTADTAPNDKPNKTLYPIADKGPFHCIILAPGTLDTKGGPVINPKAQVLDSAGRVIPGLYGAGNCIASPARQAYWAGGATIGAAMTFGYVAAMNALKEAV